jgi:hypothetical protein
MTAFVMPEPSSRVIVRSKAPGRSVVVGRGTADSAGLKGARSQSCGRRLRSGNVSSDSPAKIVKAARSGAGQVIGQYVVDKEMRIRWPGGKA